MDTPTQIAEILTRLDKLEREALTVEKLRNLEPASLVDAINWDGGKLCFGTGADAGTIDSKGNMECPVGTIQGD